MNRIFLAVIIMLIGFGLQAQEDDINEGKKKYYENEAQDRLVFGFTFDNWFNDVDNLKTKWNSWGFHFHFMYDIPIGKSKFSFAPGIGINASWVKNNSYLDDNVDSLPGQTVFVPWPDSISYKRNSLMTLFLDIPLELRFRSKPNDKNKSFKMGLGVIGGVRMHAHTKIRTNDEDITGSDNGVTKTIKTGGRWPNLANFKFGPTLRIGYASFNVFFYYSVTSMFKIDQGPDIHPFSAGFSINGL